MDRLGVSGAWKVGTAGRCRVLIAGLGAAAAMAAAAAADGVPAKSEASGLPRGLLLVRGLGAAPSTGDCRKSRNSWKLELGLAMSSPGGGAPTRGELATLSARARGVAWMCVMGTSASVSVALSKLSLVPGVAAPEPDGSTSVEKSKCWLRRLRVDDPPTRELLRVLSGAPDGAALMDRVRLRVVRGDEDDGSPPSPPRLGVNARLTLDRPAMDGLKKSRGDGAPISPLMPMLLMPYWLSLMASEGVGGTRA